MRHVRHENVGHRARKGPGVVAFHHIEELGSVPAAFERRAVGVGGTGAAVDGTEDVLAVAFRCSAVAAIIDLRAAVHGDGRSGARVGQQVPAVRVETEAVVVRMRDGRDRPCAGQIEPLVLFGPTRTHTVEARVRECVGRETGRTGCAVGENVGDDLRVVRIGERCRDIALKIRGLTNEHAGFRAQQAPVRIAAGDPQFTDDEAGLLLHVLELGLVPLRR